MRAGWGLSHSVEHKPRDSRDIIGGGREIWKCCLVVHQAATVGTADHRDSLGQLPGKSGTAEADTKVEAKLRLGAEELSNIITDCKPAVIRTLLTHHSTVNNFLRARVEDL